MPFDITVNDAILQPFLMARDSDESQRELMILFSVHAEARMMGIIMSRICSYLNGQEHIAEVDDLYSEAKTRLLTYLRDRQSYATVLTEAIRFWIPKLPLQSQAGENLAHLVRLRTPRILLQSG